MTSEIALTGINAASTQLDSIANNIANNATTGYKRSRVEFADVYALSTFGGNSPAVGQGVQVAGVRQEFGQGDMTFTNRNLDLSVEGLGMFKLNDNGSSTYTRSGNFGMDREGYITDLNGNKLTGFGVSAEGVLQPIETDLQIDYTDLEPRASSSIDVEANLDIKAPILPPFDSTDPGTFNFSTSTTVYDSLGSAQVANIYFRRDAPNTWSAFSFVGGMAVSTDPLVGDQVNFTPDGALQDVNGDPSGVFSSTLFNPVSGSDPMQITYDISKISQFDNGFGVNRIQQDGYAAGRLEDFDIDDTGTFFGRFSNGQAKTMGQITLTNFSNPEGLRQIGATRWQETFASGEPATGEPGSASLGKLRAGGLEGSNVDITKELVEMITAQRSFQANAQVISTGDTLTQTVINIRR
ncbi:MAG: flagellar hook protein FlgE [Granulosicoccus sp.]